MCSWADVSCDSVEVDALVKFRYERNTQRTTKDNIVKSRSVFASVLQDQCAERGNDPRFRSKDSTKIYQPKRKLKVYLPPSCITRRFLNSRRGSGSPMSVIRVNEHLTNTAGDPVIPKTCDDEFDPVCMALFPSEPCTGTTIAT